MTRTETQINGGLTLCEYREGIRFGTDAFLLADFARGRLGSGLCADFGTGSGVLPLLLAKGGSKARFVAVELQEAYAALAKENVSRNGFADRIEVVCGDLRRHRELFVSGSMSTVISNPPYLPKGCGKQNLADEKRLAWHDDSLTVTELADAAAWALKSGGKFFCVYLPSRLAGLFAALRGRAIEPKRVRLVAPSQEEAPSLVLVEAKKDAAEGLVWMPNLHLYTDRTHAHESGELCGMYASFG